MHSIRQSFLLISSFSSIVIVRKPRDADLQAHLSDPLHDLSEARLALQISPKSNSAHECPN